MRGRPTEEELRIIRKEYRRWVERDERMSCMALRRYMERLDAERRTRITMG